jgi:hypothetical protein
MSAREITEKLRAFWAMISQEWVRGVKHPDTPPLIFRNTLSHDYDHAKTKSRCKICGHAISDEPKERHEVIFSCDRSKCLCSEPFVSGLVSHVVCDVCHSMHHAIYVNWSLENRDYFKKFDDELAKLRGTDGRRRMGLD